MSGPLPPLPPVQPPGAPPPAFDRKAVITIQGGGVYGLSLLGQLQGLLDKGVEPFALAGTSAGAIVATLFWAGLEPDRIRAHFANLAKSPTGLSNLVGPFGTGAGRFDYATFRRTVLRYQKYVQFLQREFESGTWDAEHWPRRVLNWLLGLPDALRVVRDVLFPFRRLAARRGLFPGTRSSGKSTSCSAPRRSSTRSRRPTPSSRARRVSRAGGP